MMAASDRWGPEGRNGGRYCIPAAAGATLLGQAVRLHGPLTAEKSFLNFPALIIAPLRSGRILGQVAQTLTGKVLGLANPRA